MHVVRHEHICPELETVDLPRSVQFVKEHPASYRIFEERLSAVAGERQLMGMAGSVVVM
jgi:hypothetical protein